MLFFLSTTTGVTSHWQAWEGLCVCNRPRTSWLVAVTSLSGSRTNSLAPALLSFGQKADKWRWRGEVWKYTDVWLWCWTDCLVNHFCRVCSNRNKFHWLTNESFRCFFARVLVLTIYPPASLKASLILLSPSTIRASKSCRALWNARIVSTE